MTMLSRRNHNHGKGIAVGPGAFVQPEAPDDKVHPHFYCDASELIALNEPAALLQAHDEEHSAPGSFHWHCLFELPREAGGPK